jgi:hypothetical protein
MGMVQVQIRITIKDDGALQMLYEVLPREDAKEHELKIAYSLEQSFAAINAKAAGISGVQLQVVRIPGTKVNSDGAVNRKDEDGQDD